MSRLAPDSRQFRALPTEEAFEPDRPVRVCIASPDLVGPVRNGGVGTAFTALAVALAEAGHQVTLLYIGGSFCENGRLEDWIDHYRQLDIEFVPLPEVAFPKVDAPVPQIKAYETYEWLKANDRFDVVHFTEWMGSGFYALTAKKLGLHFHDTVMAVTTHGPSFWHKLNNGDFIHRPEELELDFMERRSVMLADVVASPSRYLTHWMLDHGWELPESTFIQQYVIPDAVRQRVPQDVATRKQKIDEIVFFGRLEIRKGLVLFCDALDRLAENAPPPIANLLLTFLGKVASVNGVPADEYVRSRSDRWPWSFQIVTDLDQDGVLRYLEKPGRLAVIPSLADNLPNTVLECLGGRIPFIAASSGGIPEMIAEDDHDDVCFEPRPTALADRLELVVAEGIRPGRFAVDIDETERAWLRWHEGLLATPPAGPRRPTPAADLPRVSIGMPHYNRPDYLRQALESIRALDYPSFEVVLVDDGSTSPDALAYLEELQPEFDRRGWKIVRQPNAFPGAARNNAARRATGDYLFFMDDDNYAKPHELRALVEAALYSNADVVTCFSDIVTTREPIGLGQRPDVRWLALGGPVSAGPFRNVFGDTNALVRREVFIDLGGFHEIYGVGLEDWELWARAALRGYRVFVLPEALFWYRLSGEGVNLSTPIHANMMQVLEPYNEALPPNLHGLVLMAQGMKLHNDTLQRRIRQRRLQKDGLDEQEVLLGAAKALDRMGEEQTACKLYSAAMRVARENRDGDAALKSLLGSARMFLRLEQIELARESLEAAGRVAEQLGREDALESIRDSLARMQPAVVPAAPLAGPATGRVRP